jgi:microcystin degradation protein MlrC
MKAVIAMLKHETNTFSPVPTPLARFGKAGPYYGSDARNAFLGTRTAMGAFMRVCEENGISYDTPLAADARPSGRAPDEVYRALCDAVCRAVENGCDVVMLDLHGAMVAECADDGEGALLKRLRAIKPGLPVAVALDMHANITPEMVENSTVITGYRSYPHTDQYETGLRAARIVLDAMAGKIEPIMVWGQPPMLAHTLCMGTQAEPFQTLMGMTVQAEQAQGILDASVFGGFTLADIARPCLSALVVADADRAAAQAQLDVILDHAWKSRAAMVYQAEPLEASIARAAACRQGPVLLIDHADNCASGGTQDTMHVLKEVLSQGMDDLAMFAVCDPWAVARMIEAGVGQTVTLPIGGKMDMPAIGLRGEPLTLTGRVKLISDGMFTVSGPVLTGTQASMGRTAVFQTDQADIVVCERHHEPWDLGCLRSVGIEPTRKKFVLLKSRMHYRAVFAPIAREIIECNGVGVTSSDYALFDFKALRRPLFPLDQDARWQEEIGGGSD